MELGCLSDLHESHRRYGIHGQLWIFARAVSRLWTTEVLRGVGGRMTPSLLAALECLHWRGVGGVGDLACDLG